MNQKDADEIQFQLAISAARAYYGMYRTSLMLCGKPPMHGIGMSLGVAIYIGLRSK